MTIADQTASASVAGLTDEPGPAQWTAVRDRAARWQPPPRPTTVVVPHPDDEALMFAGLIMAQCQRGIPIDVIAVTDGEAAYADVDRRGLAATRRREQRAALDDLGIDPARVHRLGLPDGHVGDHVDELTAAIVECANPVVVAPWRHDHHCDHEACGRAATAAAARLAGAVFGGVFWAWHHTPTDALGGGELVALDLPDPTWSRRRRALRRHRSQLEHVAGPPVLTDRWLEPIQWRREYYVVETEASARHAADSRSAT